MTDARIEGWRALIVEHGGDREKVIEAAGVSRDTLDGAFRRARSSFARECEAAGRHAAPSGAASVIQAQSNDYSGRAWQSYQPRPGWEPPVSAGKGRGAEEAASVLTVVLADSHIPYHSLRDVDCARGVIHDLQPDRVHLLGDIMELEALSRHPKSKPDLTRLAEEYYATNVALDDLQNAAPNAAWRYFQGNHESRADRFACELGALDGMLDVAASLYITPRGDYHRETAQLRGISWIPLSMQPLVIDAAAYLHGVFECKHHAAAHAESLGPRHGAHLTVTAHMHGYQSAVSSAGFRAVACPWLGDERAACFRAYVKGKPRPWSRGLLIIEETGPLVTVTHVPIVNGRALFGGRVVAA